MATIKEQTLIRNLYPRLRDLAEDVYNNPVAIVRNIELDKEREHRHLAPAGWRAKNFSADDAAQFFTLLFTFQGLNSQYEVDHILNTRMSALYGQAIARKYRAAIMNEFTQVEIVELLALDYSKLIE